MQQLEQCTRRRRTAGCKWQESRPRPNRHARGTGMHRRWSATYSLPMRRWRRSVHQPRGEAVSLRERWLLGSQAAMLNSSARSNSGLPPIYAPCHRARIHKNCCRPCTTLPAIAITIKPEHEDAQAGSVCIRALRSGTACGLQLGPRNRAGARGDGRACAVLSHADQCPPAVPPMPV